MSAESCRLCLSSTIEPSNRIPCYGSNANCVAEILLKHFWIQLHPDRDTRAFVCCSCWGKVNAFHKFYTSLLELHESRSAAPAPKQEFAIGVDEKLETAQVKEPADEEDAFVCAFDDDDIKSVEDNDVDDVAEPEQPLAKRKRGRPSKLPVCAAQEKRIEGSPEQPLAKRKRGRPPKTPLCKSQEKLIEGSPEDSSSSSSCSFSSSSFSSEGSPEQPLVKRKPGRPRKTPVFKAHEKRTEVSPSDSSSSDPVFAAQLAQFFTLLCDLCATPLPDLLAARHHHQQVHKQRGYLRCGCGKSFTRNPSIREHCAFHADTSPWRCEQCCKIFSGDNYWLAHQRRCHPATMEKVRRVMSVADRPLKRNALEDDELLRRFVSMVCGDCGVGYDSFAAAKKHFKQVHQMTGYVECCGKRFLKKWSAVSHCRWHENPKLFDCPQCDRTFSDNFALRQHRIRRHPSDTNAPYAYDCPHCPARFQLNEQLRNHQRCEHPQPGDKRFECFICHRQFIFINRLRNHLRNVHDNAASFVCEVCARSFRSRTTYDLHHSVEHGTVSLKCQCPECGRWLKHPAMLRWHQQQHRADPQRCDQCDHVARTRLALKAHQRLNHTERRHPCLACEKRFRTPLALREHMAIHTGVTDLYTCAYCPRTFRSIANMYKHRRRLHGAQFEVDRKAARLATDERNRADVAARVAAAAEAAMLMRDVLRGKQNVTPIT